MGLSLPALMAFSPQAEAAVVLRYDLQTLAQDADVIVVGQVISVESFWVGQRIKTRARVAVEQGLKGVKGGQQVTVEVPGGGVGDIGQKVPGAPTFSEGESVVLFLTGSLGQAPLKVLGLSQGKVSVEYGLTGPEVVWRLNGLTPVLRTAEGLLVETGHVLPTRQSLEGFVGELAPWVEKPDEPGVRP